MANVRHVGGADRLFRARADADGMNDRHCGAGVSPALFNAGETPAPQSVIAEFFRRSLDIVTIRILSLKYDAWKTANSRRSL
jgi:hypothetical protein